MRVLLIGNGGREHALCWKLSQSPLVRKIFCAPGNPGTARVTKSENIRIPAEDIPALVAFSSTEGVDLAIVGPGKPLVLGIVDCFRERGLKILGPHQIAAGLESSKVFAKQVLKVAGVPTADSGVFEDLDKAQQYFKACAYPVVLKADGAAPGRRGLIARQFSEASDFARTALLSPVWEGQVPRLLVEEFLEGEVISFFLLTDGNSFLPLATTRNYRRLLDGDQGPDTEGMGTYSPASSFTPQVQAEVTDRIVRPLFSVLRERDFSYPGVLCIGLMLTKQGPKVLNLHTCFGDPEAQAILPRLESDLVEILVRVMRGRLAGTEILWKKETAVNVVLASEGYPAKAKSNQRIRGTDRASDQTLLFHAGTGIDAEHIIVRGGRVLSVTALAPTLGEARDRAYRAADRIEFDGKVIRRDIGGRPSEASPSA